MRAWFALGAALVSQPALAHAMLEHASPSAGATVTAAKEIVLTYSEALEPTFSTVELRTTSGAAVAATAKTDGTTMRLTTKPLTPGTYKVTWHAVSVDTHRTEGSFTFTVKP